MGSSGMRTAMSPELSLLTAAKRTISKLFTKKREQQPAARHFTYAVTTAAKACEMPAVLLHLGNEGGFLSKPRTVHLYVSTCSLQALKQLSRRNKRLSCQKPLR